MLQRLRAGLPAVEPSSALTTYRAVSANFMKRHVTASGLRSAREIKRILDRYILSAWGDREFTSIRRADTTALLDGVEDACGAPQADAVLGVIRRLSNWYATRVDDYVPPVVRGMRRAIRTAANAAGSSATTKSASCGLLPTSTGPSGRCSKSPC